MADVDQLTKDEAAIWKKMRWHLTELRHIWETPGASGSIRNHLFELERSFDTVARQAEAWREKKREAAIAGAHVCTFCLKNAIEGSNPPICGACSLDYNQRNAPRRLGWLQWFANLWNPRGRMDNAIFSYTRAAEKCREGLGNVAGRP
jgi:hypothetical protein